MNFLLKNMAINGFFMGLVSSSQISEEKDSVVFASTNSTQPKYCSNSTSIETECEGIYNDGEITYYHIAIFFIFVIVIVTLDLAFNTNTNLPMN